MCTVPIFIILIGLLVFVSNATAMPWNNEPTGQTLSTLSADTGVTFDTAEVGNQVSVDVRNKSGSPFEFSAGLVGTIAK